MHWKRVIPQLYVLKFSLPISIHYHLFIIIDKKDKFWSASRINSLKDDNEGKKTRSMFLPISVTHKSEALAVEASSANRVKEVDGTPTTINLPSMQLYMYI